MTAHDQEFYKEAILEHIAAIQEYLPGSKETFLKDEKTYDAILMRLFAIGEELSAVRDILNEKNPDIEWHKIIGLRNRIAHGYWEVDKDTIWEILTDGSLEELHDILN
ncbi:MAG TPA: HepT-like ribonuclease domain-containing protein [Candidatus Binatia bacterium]|jgi:uncharacterized protein with HEPN domain|nr:HepT-like ribonuclease domain-containing protein [Candidatus Binatia bacterium]